MCRGWGRIPQNAFGLLCQQQQQVGHFASCHKREQKWARCKKSKNINSKTSCQHQFASTRQTLTKKGCSCKEAYLSNSPHDGFVLQIHKPNIFCVWHLNLPCWQLSLSDPYVIFVFLLTPAPFSADTKNTLIPDLNLRFLHKNTLIHFFLTKGWKFWHRHCRWCQGQISGMHIKYN